MRLKKSTVMTGSILALILLSSCIPLNQPDPGIETGETLQPTAIRIVETPDQSSSDPSGAAVSPSDLEDDPEAQPIDPILDEFVLDASADLVERLGVEVEDVELVLAEAVEWADSCLGCPEEDEICSGVVTAGYLIQLSAGGMVYEYHTALDWMRFCENLP